MRKYISRIFILLFLFICFFTIDCFANTTIDKITNYNMIIDVNEDSSMNIEESFSINIDTAGNYNIRRYFPAEYEGKKLDIEVIEITENENKLDFSVSKINRNFVVQLNQNNVANSGIHSYVINYKIKNAMKFKKDASKLYFRFFGDSWFLPIDGYSMRVNFPEGISFLEDSFKVYSDINNLKTEDGSINKKIENNSLVISSNKVTYPGEDIVLNIEFSNGKIQKNGFKENFSRFLSENEISFVILIGGIILFIWHLTELDKKKERDLFEVSENFKGKIKILLSLSGVVLTVMLALLVGLEENYLCAMNYVLNVYIKFCILGLVEISLFIILYFTIRYEMYKKGWINKILGLMICLPIGYVGTIFFLNYFLDIYYNLFAYLSLLLIFAENICFAMKIKGKKVFELTIDEEKSEITTVER